MSNLIKSSNWNFLKWGKLSLIISVLIIFVGGAAIYKTKNTIFGMDFTGGYAINLEIQPNDQIDDYKSLIEKSLLKNGAGAQDIQVRELTPSNNLKLFISKSMNLEGKPFYEMPVETKMENAKYSYEKNPRINWIVSSLKDSNIDLAKSSLNKLDQNWKSISGQMSDSMKNNAIKGLLLALVCILVYITFRFEFKYAISATIGLAFDILISIGILGILHMLNVPIQIDLNIVAALMTIIGYSLNDTIIVFDRIREDVKSTRDKNFYEIINHALNTTLSRTIMTSTTTLVVLIALVFIGGSSIFGFSLIMAIGVVIGTLSTLFISSILLFYFQNRNTKKINPTKNNILNGI